MNPSMLAKVETFKEAAEKTFADATDFIFTSKEILEIRDNNPGLVIPGVIWKSSIDDNTARILPMTGKARKLFDLNKSIEMCNGKISIPANKKVAPIVAPTIAAPTQPIPTTEIQPTNVLSLSKLADNEHLDPTDYIPLKSEKYVASSLATKVSTVIKSKKFFPLLIVGNKGYGKTFMIEQVCAKFKRPLVRINFTAETDESKLIGSMNLVDGNTVWTDGLVLKAMKMGAVLLMDEVDLAGEKIMCLQSIMEGNSYINKKTGEVITPAAGFTVIATSNTKGQGNTDGRYVGAKKMNAAFLDRIKMIFMHTPPTAAVETRILKKLAVRFCTDELTDKDNEIISSLTFWAESIRKAFDSDVIEDDISTRRLSFILESYFMFNRDIDFAIISALNTYDEDDINSIVSLWRASHGVDKSTESENADIESEKF